MSKPRLGIYLNRSPWTDYRNPEKLGSGSYGIVWSAIRGDRSYAIKETVLPVSRDILKSIPETFVRELSSMYTLNNTGISPFLYAVYTTDTSLFIVMEKFKADLWTVVEKRPKFPRLLYVHSLVTKLHLMMTKGIMHRDIKPNNILFDGNEIAYGDYGTSRYMSYVPSQMTAHIFALLYSPPEVLFGDQYYSYSVDVWCLGASLLELLSGVVVEVPYSGIAQTDIAHTLSYLRDLLGEPTKEQLGKYYDVYKSYALVPKKHFSLMELTLLRKITPDELSFLNHMLAWNPEERWAPFELLNHPYLSDTYGKFKFTVPDIIYNPTINARYSGIVLENMNKEDLKIARRSAFTPSDRYTALYPIFQKIPKLKLETVHLAVYLFDAASAISNFPNPKQLAMACLQLATYEYELRTHTLLNEYDNTTMRDTMLQVLDLLGTVHYPGYITMYRLYYHSVINRSIHKQYMNIALLYGLNTKYGILDVISNIIQITGSNKYNPLVYEEVRSAIDWYNNLRSDLVL